MKYALVLVLLGCGGSKAEAPPPAPAAKVEPPCNDVATNEIKLMKVGFLTAETKQKMHDSIVKHCMTDGWSVDAATCYATAADFKELDVCKTKLTQAQIDAMKESHAPNEGSGSAN